MKFPEQHRIQPPNPVYRSNPNEDGLFEIPARVAHGRTLRVLASRGIDLPVQFEHASVSLVDYPTKCPGWLEMCLVKSLFWDDSECVMQLHPPIKDHVDYSKKIGREVLHLWKPLAATIPMPPKICI